MRTIKIIENIKILARNIFHKCSDTEEIVVSSNINRVRAKFGSEKLREAPISDPKSGPIRNIDCGDPGAMSNLHNDRKPNTKIQY